MLSRLFPAKQKQELPAPRRHHHLNTSPYRIIVVPDAVLPFIENVTSSDAGRLIDLIAHRSVNLEECRGMDDSEFFLFWDEQAYLHPDADPDAPPMQWLIAQIHVYTREIKDILWPHAFARKFGHYEGFRYPHGMEFSLAKHLAGIDDSADCEPEISAYFDLRCIDAMTDEITVTCLGKVTAADWHDHVDEMLALARPLARNTRSAHLYALLGKKRQGLLAEFDVSGSQA